MGTERERAVEFRKKIRSIYELPNRESCKAFFTLVHAAINPSKGPHSEDIYNIIRMDRYFSLLGFYHQVVVSAGDIHFLPDGYSSHMALQEGQNLTELR